MLIDALNAHGDKEMAQDYLNSGNTQLDRAARSWAEEHGYDIGQTWTFGSGGDGLTWGSGQ